MSMKKIIYIYIHIYKYTYTGSYIWCFLEFDAKLYLYIIVDRYRETKIGKQRYLLTKILWIFDIDILKGKKKEILITCLYR